MTHRLKFLSTLKIKTMDFWKIFLPVTLVFLLASCGGKQAGDNRNVPEEPDSTMYIVLDSHTSDSLTFTQIDSKRRRTMGYASAKERHAVYGTLTDGDTLAVVPQFRQKRILSSVNYSQLVGLWMFEGGDGNGMRLNTDGAACSVGPSEITLREWKLRNGNFILTYVKGDGSDYAEKADTSSIKVLESGRFVFTLHGKTYTCRRMGDGAGQED